MPTVEDYRLRLHLAGWWLLVWLTLCAELLFLKEQQGSWHYIEAKDGRCYSCGLLVGRATYDARRSDGLVGVDLHLPISQIRFQRFLRCVRVVTVAGILSRQYGGLQSHGPVRLPMRERSGANIVRLDRLQRVARVEARS